MCAIYFIKMCYFNVILEDLRSWADFHFHFWHYTGVQVFFCFKVGCIFMCYVEVEAFHFPSILF